MRLKIEATANLGHLSGCEQENSLTFHLKGKEEERAGGRGGDGMQTCRGIVATIGRLTAFSGRPLSRQCQCPEPQPQCRLACGNVL
jgi:hypothetical protein